VQGDVLAAAHFPELFGMRAQAMQAGGIAPQPQRRLHGPLLRGVGCQHLFASRGNVGHVRDQIAGPAGQGDLDLIDAQGRSELFGSQCQG